jgi:predicted Fe-Mo cluster-binding NifX family protein
MKVAMPVGGKSMDAGVYQSFGRAPYYIVYDTQTKESTFTDNQAASSQGGAGIKAAQTVVDLQVSALLTPQCGENAASVLNAANIALYKTSGTSIQENLDAFVAERLPALYEIHGGFHQHG